MNPTRFQRLSRGSFSQIVASQAAVYSSQPSLFHFTAVISEYLGHFTHVDRIAGRSFTHLVHERFESTWPGDVDLAAKGISHILKTTGDTPGLTRKYRCLHESFGLRRGSRTSLEKCTWPSLR